MEMKRCGNVFTLTNMIMRRQPDMKEIKPSPYRKAIRFFSFCNHLTYGSTDSVIAETILMHIRNVDRITLEGIADKSNISLSSVSRFFTKCGFDGIQDFKLSLSEYLNAGGKMRTRSFLREYAGMEYSDLSRSMKERGENSLNATYMQTDIEKLQDPRFDDRMDLFYCSAGFGHEAAWHTGSPSSRHDGNGDPGIYGRQKTMNFPEFILFFQGPGEFPLNLWMSAEGVSCSPTLLFSGIFPEKIKKIRRKNQ